MPERNPGRYLIYGLLDPRDEALRYIGKTHKRREIRLAEHIEAAREGDTWPLHNWIRELMDADAEPVIFVLERIPGSASWQEAEKKAIATWREWPDGELPHVHPPQTPKSRTITIRSVDLLNVRAGG